MDPVTPATGAVSLLVPHLAKAGKAVTDKIGQEVWDKVSNKVEKLYETIKNKFTGNDYANQTLKRLEEKPEDKDRQSAMQSVLKEVLVEDPQFQKMLSQILAETAFLASYTARWSVIIHTQHYDYDTFARDCFLADALQ